MFRRSGSVSTYFYEGKLVAPSTDDFREALAGQRFRTIENAASEELSIGWVTSGDPTGDSFDEVDLDLDVGVHLRMRMDKKSLPTAWMAIHRSVAEKSAGRKLTARERKELKEDLMQKLLPRVLPSVGMVDALLVPKRKTVLLFSTSKGAQEEFGKLFFRTFAVNLIAGDPYAVARRSGLGQEQSSYLDRTSPVSWPRKGVGGSPHQRPVEPIAQAAVAQTAEVGDE